MEAVAQMSEIHEENLTWINNLRFYEEEIKALNQRLEVVARISREPELMAQVEHFQNQFIRQREVVDDIKHHVKISDRVLFDSGQHAADTPPALLYNHDGMRDEYETFEKIYHELKADFEHFLAQAV